MIGCIVISVILFLLFALLFAIIYVPELIWRISNKNKINAIDVRETNKMLVGYAHILNDIPTKEQRLEQENARLKEIVSSYERAMGKKGLYR